MNVTALDSGAFLPKVPSELEHVKWITNQWKKGAYADSINLDKPCIECYLIVKVMNMRATGKTKIRLSVM